MSKERFFYKNILIPNKNTAAAAISSRKENMASITISLDIGDLNLLDRYATAHGMKPSKAAAALIRRGMAAVIAEQEQLKKFKQQEEK